MYGSRDVLVPYGGQPTPVSVDSCATAPDSVYTLPGVWRAGP